MIATRGGGSELSDLALRCRRRSSTRVTREAPEGLRRQGRQNSQKRLALHISGRKRAKLVISSVMIIVWGAKFIVGTNQKSESNILH